MLNHFARGELSRGLPETHTYTLTHEVMQPLNAATARSSSAPMTHCL